MTSIKLYPGDNRASLRRLIKKGVRVHSVVTDPPYGLVSVQKRFGKQGSKPARTEKNDGSFARLSGGFMGKTWDGTGIERDPEFWSLIYDILLPGGYVFAFSGSRTGHWQACAMELAGFIMHPMHGWVFGSGFPKAHAADKAIVKFLGIDLDHPDETSIAFKSQIEDWEGWAYSTQAQKPALEPIYLGQRPFDRCSGAANLLTHGVGAVNIHDCRVPFADESDEAESKAKNQHKDFGSGAMTNQVYGKYSKDRDNYNPSGRHPSNLLLDGSKEVDDLLPGTGSASAARFFHKFRYACELCLDTGIAYTPMHCIGDSPTLEGCECGGPLHLEIDPIVYQGKAAKADRAGSNHPTVKPIALMRYLIRHITPPGGTVLDPFAGSGTTAEAARREGFDCMIMEAEPEYVGFLRSRFDLPAPVPKDVLNLIGAPKVKRAPEDLINLL